MTLTQVSSGDVSTTDTQTDTQTDMAVYHLLSLNLLSRLHYGEEQITRDMFSDVIFNVDFLRQVAILSLLSMFCSPSPSIDNI